MAKTPIKQAFGGSWQTTFGPMKLRQRGSRIAGTYHHNQIEGQLEGRLEGNRLHFSYREPSEKGKGMFRLLRAGRFSGTYTAEGASGPHPWDGERGWDGIWESQFGRLRLMHEEDRVHGWYEGAGPSVIEGKDRNGVLQFRYREKRVTGTGRFVQRDDGDAFEGQWKPRGARQWRPWHGRRLFPERGLTWLLVLEAHWQRSLAENEYAFGHMLREVFARLPQVRVRQRFFHDADSLDHWCRELLYIPEPAILMIASHGVADGLAVHGEIINTKRVLESVRHAGNLKLLHFSSCLVGLDGQRALTRQPFPVSGYTTSVDWGASALLEFTYLDLMLARRLDPAAAASALPKLLTYTGDRVAEDSPYPAAGFRFFPAAES